MGKTYTWIGTSGIAASATIAADWSPSGGPPSNGDSEIIGLNGTVAEGDGPLRSNTVVLDGGRMTFAGDSLVTLTNPSLDSASLITTATTPNSVSTSTMDALGNFVNQGTILAAGAAGSALTINIGTTVINGVSAPANFNNPGTVGANAGNTLTINIGATSELFNSGTILANGGTVRIVADPAAIAGGDAPVSGTADILAGGTLETNTSFPASGAGGTVTVRGAGSVIRTTGTAAIFVGSAGTGLLSVTNGGSVSDANALVIGLAAGSAGTVVVNAATVAAASLAIGNAASQAASGLLSIGPGGAVNLSGNAVVNKSGYVTLSGGALNVPISAALNLAAGGEVDGFGQVSDAGGLNNAGTIVAAGGVLELSAGSGAMGIAPGATLTLDFGFSGVASFNGGGGELSLGAPGATSGTIDGFGAGDTLSLSGVVNATGVALGAGNVLTVSQAGGAQLTFQFDPTQSFAGATFSETVSGATTDITVAGVAAPGPVIAAYAGILRVPVTASTAAVVQATSLIAANQLTVAQFDSQLINSEQALYTTLPALVSIDAFYGATPQPATLTAVATSSGTPAQVGGFYGAEYLHDLGYSDPNVWTIMASQWGADQNSAFFKQYNGFGTDYSDFIAAVYQREFGFAPSAANLQTLVNDVPGVQALLAGGGGAATPIQVVSGIYGYLLYVGQTTPSLPTQYGTAANAFLVAAANGTANYGQELTQQFPAAGTGSVTSSALAADPSVITVTSSDQLIDPGTGNFTIRFQPGTSGDTLMLHTGGVDQVSGFDPGTDILDVGSLLAGTGLAMTDDVASLSGYLTVADQGANAVVRFDPSGQGGGSPVAVLQGLGSSVTGLDSLIAHGAVRMG